MKPVVLVGTLPLAVKQTTNILVIKENIAVHNNSKLGVQHAYKANYFNCTAFIMRVHDKHQHILFT